MHRVLKVLGGSAADWNMSNSAYSDVLVSPLAAFDSTGLVFAVTAPMAANSTAASAAGGGGQHLHLYNAQNYTSGAFTEWASHMVDIGTMHATTRPRDTGTSITTHWGTLDVIAIQCFGESNFGQYCCWIVHHVGWF